ncbi:BrxA family protein [Dyadobacter chenhuakuii]|uniref:DUF1819 family protein n=1 Tax=Dyadobacter chenhuakuii TaxID=2909339 RepID=A0ABY4XLT6_9BACT|nr:BrxA family protein [Dyadobacter chenhuakuii]MCF2494280.1 DUF1819 family protein [Dyadobacter chenhuakuii]USJ31405.1 DUF1819 family protein [Dyadobacter chenhuakuii]
MKSVYTADLLKATGLVQETLALLEAYQPGQPKDAFGRFVKETDLLGKATQNRVDDILRSNFFRRYVAAGSETVAALKSLQANQIGFEVLNQLFLVFTCRANTVLSDFIRQVYWPKVAAGESRVQTTDPAEFIQNAISERRTKTIWAASTSRKVAEHLIACLIDFQLVEKNKVIREFSPADATINFLLHEGHFKGLSDMQLLRLPDWAVLGLSTNDLIRRIYKLAQRGHFIAQYSGELLTISWFYQSLPAAADGISRV